MLQTQKQWQVIGNGSFDNLSFNVDSPWPSVGEHDVLVRFHGASINYRDLSIATGTYPFPTRAGVVPGSDGAGQVIEVGNAVKRFRPGDKVLMAFFQDHMTGDLDERSIMTGYGGQIDGTMRQIGAINEQSLVHMPKNLNFMEAATLTCAGLTAWNALLGLEGKRVKPGDWVLTQGTGGVSIFALQFAKAAGARVIATTSTAEKGAKLHALGADFVINYKTDPTWGETAKRLTGNIGVQHVVEIGGESTMPQSFVAGSIGCVISVIGYIGGEATAAPATFIDCLKKACIVRGIQIGSRSQLEDMVQAVEANDTKPQLDHRTFRLEELKEAYQYQEAQKHYGKIGVEID